MNRLRKLFSNNFINLYAWLLCIPSAIVVTILCIYAASGEPGATFWSSAGDLFTSPILLAIMFPIWVILGYFEAYVIRRATLKPGSNES